MNLEYTDFLKAQALFAEINAADLAEIKFCHNGVPISLHPEDIENWKFTGLSNKSFFEALDERNRVEWVCERRYADDSETPT